MEGDGNGLCPPGNLASDRPNTTADDLEGHNSAADCHYGYADCLIAQLSRPQSDSPNGCNLVLHPPLVCLLLLNSHQAMLMPMFLPSPLCEPPTAVGCSCGGVG